MCVGECGVYMCLSVLRGKRESVCVSVNMSVCVSVCVGECVCMCLSVLEGRESVCVSM